MPPTHLSPRRIPNPCDNNLLIIGQPATPRHHPGQAVAPPQPPYIASVVRSRYLELIESLSPVVGRPLGRCVALKGDLQPGQVMFHQERLSTLVECFFLFGTYYDVPKAPVGLALARRVGLKADPRPPWMAGVPETQEQLSGRPPWMAGGRAASGTAAESNAGSSCRDGGSAESANAPSMARGPRLDPIGENARAVLPPTGSGHVAVMVEHYTGSAGSPSVTSKISGFCSI
jgi:hypothetical protein